MLKFRTLIAVIAIIIIASLAHHTTCSSAPPDQVTELPGFGPLDPDEIQYSGYVPVSSGSALHYWFFEQRDYKLQKRSENWDQYPVVVWLNGGPVKFTTMFIHTYIYILLSFPSFTIALRVF